MKQIGRLNFGQRGWTSDTLAACSESYLGDFVWSIEARAVCDVTSKIQKWTAAIQKNPSLRLQWNVKYPQSPYIVGMTARLPSGARCRVVSRADGGSFSLEIPPPKSTLCWCHRLWLLRPIGQQCQNGWAGDPEPHWCSAGSVFWLSGILQWNHWVTQQIPGPCHMGTYQVWQWCTTNGKAEMPRGGGNSCQNLLVAK